MNDNCILRLNSPITEEEWDMIIDVDFDNTEQIWFHTKHGKEVHFYKDAIPIEYIVNWTKRLTGYEQYQVSDIVNQLLKDWRNEK